VAQPRTRIDHGEKRTGILEEVIMKQFLQKHRIQSEWAREAAGAGVEAVLFISVQAVMLVCVVLVAAQLIVTA